MHVIILVLSPGSLVRQSLICTLIVFFFSPFFPFLSSPLPTLFTLKRVSRVRKLASADRTWRAYNKRGGRKTTTNRAGTHLGSLHESEARKMSLLSILLSIVIESTIRTIKKDKKSCDCVGKQTRERNKKKRLTENGRTGPDKNRPKQSDSTQQRREGKGQPKLNLFFFSFSNSLNTIVLYSRYKVIIGNFPQPRQTVASGSRVQANAAQGW